nr:MAG TPA: Endodeoxyribonuclease RusA [Caudoviricetes sp.]
MKLVLNIEPKPQSRPRFARCGNFTTTYEDKDMKSWRNHCQLLIDNQYMGQPILEGALRAKVRFYIKPPQYIFKAKKNQQALLDEIIPVDKRPDIDNYEKALYDSMSEIVFKDDGQIALHDVGKFYSLKPRIEVEIEEINKNDKVTRRKRDE